ncbi:MAG TPA: ABC transporter ATP-binding protein [Nitrososphaerales archaeon]|nr:ABC transporter ATP-binding protein [Nitrososphaerales archaeon]
MSEVLIEVSNVSKKYSTRNETIEAVSSMTFDIKRGEFLTIIGPSGCGKSTMLAMIAGLLLPSSGSIKVEGKEVEGPMPERIAVAFQEPGLLPWRNVQKNIELGLEARNVPKVQRGQIAKKYIELVGLLGFGDKYPHQLSGGMKQRAAIARCLSMDTNILLLDEPFGALDEQTRLLMGEELLKILAVTSKTVLLVTHSLQEAANLSDRVIVMTKRPGRIREEIRIDLPHPRKPTDTVEYVNKLWDLIREPV